MEVLKFVRVADGSYPCYIEDLRTEYPYVSFPSNISNELAEAFGYAVVLPSEQPTKGDVIVEGSPLLKNGSYYQNWQVRNFSPEELAQQLSVSKVSVASVIEGQYNEALKTGMPYNYGVDKVHIGVTKESLTELNFIAIANQFAQPVTAPAQPKPVMMAVQPTAKPTDVADAQVSPSPEEKPKDETSSKAPDAGQPEKTPAVPEEKPVEKPEVVVQVSTVEGTMISVTETQFKDLYLQVLSYVQGLQQRLSAAKKAIEAATDEKTLKAVVF